MDPLPYKPRTLRDLVEADLRRAARLIIKIQDEIDWQLRLATPHGDYHLAVTMPTDDHEHRAMMRRMQTFMQWKEAAAFCLAVEIREPDAVYAVGISTREQVGCIARIRREPKPWRAANFGAVEWLPQHSFDMTLAPLLPHTPRAMTPKEIAALEKWFGLSGKFPAVHVPTGEVKGL